MYLVLIIRIATDKLNPNKSRKISSRSSISLFVISLALILIAIADYHISSEYVSIALALILILAIISAFWKLKKSNPKQVNTPYLEDLPSITVAIPARNESYDLVCLLEQALKSEYPKLEIIVLDDCSGAGVNEIIKNFAHQGVIFIKGTEPKKHWLAKNWAYQQLLHNSNGKYVIFLGVDIRLTKDSVSQIVEQVLANKYDAYSVLPKRTWQKTDAYLLLQSLRYHRIVTGFRHIGSLPPPLSSCFVVERDFALKSGGFSSVRGSIYPEMTLAKKTKNYGFNVTKSGIIDLFSVKSFRGQFNTAVRTYHPLAKYRLELILLRTMVLCAMVWLSISFIIEYISYDIIIYPGAGILLLGYILHWLVGYKVGIGNLLTWTLQLPFLIISEIFVMHYSMIRYEFFEVMWKDRNVCIPLLRYEKNLEIPQSKIF